MTEEVLNVLHKIKDDDIFQNFYFIGGTALSYYLNHRISYDLDFVTLSTLDTNLLKTLTVKYDAKFIPDMNASVFKINTGNNLDEYKMMFNIDNIKLEFFYPNDALRNEIVSNYKDSADKVFGKICVLPIEAIAKLKIIALLKRNKIRDIFDVYVLLDTDTITLDDLERFYALENRKKTFVEFLENFQDDGSESLDFEDKNIYYDDYHRLDYIQKLDKIKNDFIDLIIRQELVKKKNLL